MDPDGRDFWEVMMGASGSSGARVATQNAVQQTSPEAMAAAIDSLNESIAIVQSATDELTPEGNMEQAVADFQTGVSASSKEERLLGGVSMVQNLQSAAGLLAPAVVGGKAPSRTPRITAGVCFVAGTMVAVATGQIAIEKLRVGQRVRTLGPRADGASEVDPRTWRVVHALMVNPDGNGDIIELEMLRSPEWIALTGAAPGAVIHLVLEEMGLDGPAWVTGLEPSPAIVDGPGRVVLSTVASLSATVLTLSFVETAEILEPTGRHRLYSEDQGAWIPAEDLVAGERLRTATGVATIKAITPRTGVHRVHNIEVETEHSYLVGDNLVLSHNTNPCAKVGTTRHIKLNKAKNGAYKVEFRSGKKYGGKGGTDRARRSARQRSRDNDDPVESIEHTPADTDDEAFKLEAQIIDAIGGPGGSTYNQINSPGKKKE